METLHTIFVALAYISAVGFLVFGIDDVFFDLQFLRYLRGRRNSRTVPLETLKNEPEETHRHFHPGLDGRRGHQSHGGLCAKDSPLRTLRHFHRGLSQRSQANRCVDELTRVSRRIHKAVTRLPGPTSKADCLNAIYEEMKSREIPGRREYAIIALHDAEDVLHPLTLKVYNHYVPEFLDMGQIPVFPLELSPWKYWVGNSYLDEFAEWHVKDMYSREAIGGVVPSAGVGTAFSRRALDFLASKNAGAHFARDNSPRITWWASNSAAPASGQASSTTRWSARS
jgi:adsorption protein B